MKTESQADSGKSWGPNKCISQYHANGVKEEDWGEVSEEQNSFPTPSP